MIAYTVAVDVTRKLTHLRQVTARAPRAALELLLRASMPGSCHFARRRVVSGRPPFSVRVPRVCAQSAACGDRPWPWPHHSEATLSLCVALLTPAVAMDIRLHVYRCLRQRLSEVLAQPPHPKDRSRVSDIVSERLRRLTRNPLGSARGGSNPLGVVLSSNAISSAAG